MKELSEEIIEVLENNDFVVNDVEKQDGEYYVEIGQNTPEGEDWWMTIWFDGTDENFIKSVSEIASNFDVDEEASIWIDSRGKRGVPNSIGCLLEDARWKKEILQKVSMELEDEGIEECNESMTKEMFLGYMEEKFTLNQRTCLDLLESIYDYAEKNNHCVHNHILEELIENAFNLTDREREMFYECK